MNPAGGDAKPPRKLRPFVGILFKCCHVYSRVYLNHDGTAYAGHCPKCAARIEIKVSATGSSTRFWAAD